MTTYERASCPSSADILNLVTQRRPVIGRTGKRFDTQPARSSLNNLHVLRSLMQEYKPKQTLETGFAFGGSGAVIAACHREMGEGGRGQHVAIDPFQSKDWDDVGRMMLEQVGLSEYVNVLEVFSDAALPRLVAEGWRCDLAFVDGSHLFEDVFIDSYYVNLLLQENGIVLFDDNTNPHVRKLVRFIQRNRGDSYRQLDLTRHRPPAARTLRYQIARRLGRTLLVAFEKIGECRREWNAPFRNF
jgi:predicted O-methyltransferase YrrM